VCIFAKWFDLDDALEVDDIRAVNAEKPRRIECGFEARNRLLLQVFLAA
jgi:hypothetical protein